MSLQTQAEVSRGADDLSGERRRTYRALVVEDDDGIVGLVRRVLQREEFTVECVRTGAAAIELMKVVAYDLLIIDLVLPLVSGEEVITFIDATQPTTLRRVIVMTASPRKLSSAFLERICKVLAKPFDIDELVLMARECVEGEPCGT